MAECVSASSTVHCYSAVSSTRIRVSLIMCHDTTASLIMCHCTSGGRASVELANMICTFIVGHQRVDEFFDQVTHGAALLVINRGTLEFELHLWSKNHRGNPTLGPDTLAQLRVFMHCFELKEGEFVFTPTARGSYTPHCVEVQGATKFKNPTTCGAYYDRRFRALIGIRVTPNAFRYMQSSKLMAERASPELMKSASCLQNTSVHNLETCYNRNNPALQNALAAEVQTYRYRDEYNSARNTVALYSIHAGARACHIARLVRAEESSNLYAVFKPPLDGLFEATPAALINLQLSNDFVRLPSTYQPPTAMLSHTPTGNLTITGGQTKHLQLVKRCREMGLDNAELVFVESKVSEKIDAKVGEFCYSTTHCLLLKITESKDSQGIYSAQAGRKIHHSVAQASSTQQAYFDFLGESCKDVIRLGEDDMVFPVDVQFNGAGRIPEGSFELRASIGTDTL